MPLKRTWGVYRHERFDFAERLGQGHHGPALFSWNLDILSTALLPSNQRISLCLSPFENPKDLRLALQYCNEL